MTIFDKLKYRKLIVKNVTKTSSGSFDIKFEKSIITLPLSKEEAGKFNLDSIKNGDVLYILGANGNSDTDLWGPGEIKDMFFSSVSQDPQQIKKSSTYFRIAVMFVVFTGIFTYYACYPFVVVFGLLTLGSFIASGFENLKGN